MPAANYQGIDSDSPSALSLVGTDPKRSFVEALLARYAWLNACPIRSTAAVALSVTEMVCPRSYKQPNKHSVAWPINRRAVIGQRPEATVQRVELADGWREVYSLLRNRAHSNVAFMLGEALRYQSALDTLTVYPGVLSGYPNFILSLVVVEVPECVDILGQVRDTKALDKVVERWGIRHSHLEFWRYFYDLSAYIRETEPSEAGVLDMNRYENL